MLAPIHRKLRLASSLATMDRVDDDRGVQGVAVSLLDGEATDGDVEHVQPGGLSHVPLEGAEGVFLSIGGQRDDGVIIGLSNRAKRPKGLGGGETALWSCGSKPITLHLKADGTLTIGNGDGVIEMAPGGDVTINGVKITKQGAITAPGEITAMALTPATAVTVSKHLHASAVGPTQPPTPGT